MVIARGNWAMALAMAERGLPPTLSSGAASTGVTIAVGTGAIWLRGMGTGVCPGVGVGVGVGTLPPMDRMIASTSASQWGLHSGPGQPEYPACTNRASNAAGWRKRLATSDP